MTLITHSWPFCSLLRYMIACVRQLQAVQLRCLSTMRLAQVCDCRMCCHFDRVSAVVLVIVNHVQDCCPWKEKKIHGRIFVWTSVALGLAFPFFFLCPFCSWWIRNEEGYANCRRSGIINACVCVCVRARVVQPPSTFCKLSLHFRSVCPCFACIV